MPPSAAATVQDDAPDVARLVAEARRGSVAALGALYERYARHVLRAALRVTRSRADAEDVLHDVFLHLPESLARYREQQRFDAWVAVLTTRCALDALRRDRRRAGLLAVRVAEHRDAGYRDADRADAPFAGDEDLRRAIARLPEPLHLVLVLKELEGHSHEEVASLLGITPGASRMRLARAIALLRHALRDTP